MGFQCYQKVYLFGAFFEPVFVRRKAVFPTWYQELDLTTKTELDGKISYSGHTPLKIKE